MNDAVLKPTRQRLMSYWWAPITILALIAAILAYLHPYRDLELSDLSPSVIGSVAKLDKAFKRPVRNSLKYSTRRTYTSPGGPMDIEIRVTLTPIGGGLVMRQDDWYQLKGKTVVYQERFILFRNLFSLHTRSREVAPLMHDLMGRIGWYNDSTQSVNSKVDGDTVESPSWTMDVDTDRLSETDGKGLTRLTKPYKRHLHCEHHGEVDGAEIGSMFKGSYPRVSCKGTGTDQPNERVSNYAYLPEHGIFLLLSYQQKGENADTLEVKGNYVSFEVVP
jgi:hypothetical protein